MLEEKELTAAAPSVALRDEEGVVRADFVERVQQAITTEDSAALRELLGDLHQADVGDLIEALEPELRPTLVRLMGQDFDFTALTEFIAVPPAWTVGRTIDHLRETPDLPDRFWEVYVADAAGLLQGTVALDRLLRTKRPVSIASLIDEEMHAVRVTDEQEDVARLFERYDLVATPVVDE